MTDEAAPLLSVRGEASRFVDPDLGELSATVELTRDTSRDAVEAVTTSVAAVRRELERLGGAAREAASVEEPLTWLTRRVTTSPEWDHAQGGQTDRTVATASLSIFVRDFSLVGAIEGLATTVPGFRFDHAGWHVDPGNPAWRAVRQEAVHEAMRRARDYAEALDSSLVSVDQVADIGLLAPQASPGLPAYAAAARSFDSGGGTEATLDPVPQQLSAAVEARVRIAPVPLA